MALTGCNNCLPTRPASRAILTRNRRADSVAMSFMICTWRDQSWLQPVRSIGTLAQDQCVELDSTCCVVFSSELSLTWMRQCHTLQCSTRSAQLSSASFARLDLLHFTAPRGSDEPRGATFEVTAQPEKVTHPMPSCHPVLTRLREIFLRLDQNAGISALPFRTVLLHMLYIAGLYSSWAIFQPGRALHTELFVTHLLCMMHKNNQPSRTS